MNAFVGAIDNNGGAINKAWQQFLKLSLVRNPSTILVFLDEHPDSINDGYFINRDYYPEWHDLPASYHNGAAAFSFADGHSALHRWIVASTVRPPQPDAAGLPIALPPGQRTDLEWVVNHMSIDK